MTRRQAGLLVIGLALVLVAVVAGRQTHLLAGAAEAPPIPGPPVVGDCVVDSLPGPPLVADPTVTASSGGTVPVYPAQQIRPCTGTRYGEVVSVIATPQPSAAKGDDANGRYLDDPNQDSCFFAAYHYVGMTTQPILGFWQTYLQFTMALSRPSLRQEASGQHWAACIVALSVPASETPPSARIPAPPRYASSIRDALHTGQQRDQLGVCLPVLDWNAGFTTGSCGRVHAVELLASGTSGDRPVTRDQVESTCERLVRQLTAMPDPTAAGALSIQTFIEGTNSVPITTHQVPARSLLQCGVTTTGHRKLRGSLLALGRQPIPWA